MPAVQGEEFGVGAALDDPAGVDHQDQVGAADRAEVVGNDGTGPAVDQAVEGDLDAGLGGGIDGAGGLARRCCSHV